MTFDSFMEKLNHNQVSMENESGHHKPMLSIIVPCYNVATYLERCVASVLAQTYTDWEMILVDDGSTDCTGAICDRYAAADERIRAVHTPNGGLSVARNNGIGLARGRYVSLMDSDDFLCSETIYENALRLFDEIAGLDVVQFTWKRVSRDGDIRFEHHQESCVYSGRRQYYLNFENIIGMNDRVIMTQVWNKVYRASMMRKLKFKPGKLFEDAFFDADMFALARKIALIPETGYAYVENPGSIMAQKMSDKKAYDAILSNIHILDSMKDIDIPAATRCRYFVRQIYDISVTRMIHGVRYGGDIYESLDALVPRKTGSGRKVRAIVTLCRLLGCRRTCGLLSFIMKIRGGVKS